MTSNHNRQTLAIFWQHTKRYSVVFWFILISIVMATATSAYIPLYYKQLIDLLAAGTTTDTGPLIHLVLLILLFSLTSWLFWRFATFADSYFISHVLADLTNDCFHYLQRHSYSFFTNSFAGSLVRRVNRFSRAYEDIADRVAWDFLPAMIILLATFAVLTNRYWVFGLVFISWAIIYLGFNYWFALFKLKYDLERAASDSDVTAHLSDTVTNNINIKLFGGISREERQFHHLTGRVSKLMKTSWDLDAWSEAIQGLLLVMLEFLLLYAAIEFWQQGKLTVGDFSLLQFYVIKIADQLFNIGRHVRRIYERLADADEMTTIFLTPHEIVDKVGAKKLNVRYGHILFHDVRFGYQANKQVFRHLNLEIASGERLALIGPSGGGKSTVVKLLLRFSDIQAGQILIDDQNISEVTQDSLRSQIALVPQEPILFHRSLAENIAYAKPQATEHEIIAAAKAAHCHEFISRFPDGYATLVGERGVKLSGGERQRVAIARAILQDAPILILDEATSSLDSESEHYIQLALKKLMLNRTTLVIAHRLSTIMQMDRIVVLEKGRVIEQGTHQSLLEIEQGRYQKLWGIQAGGFAS